MKTRFTKEMVQAYLDAGFWRRETYIDYLERTAREIPEREAIICDGKRVTFGEFADTVQKLARSLVGLGVRRGDVVGLQSPSCPEFYYVRYACSKTGALLAPMPPAFRGTEVETALSCTGAKVTFTPIEFHKFDHVLMLRELRGSLPDLKHIVVIGGVSQPDMLSLEELLSRGQGVDVTDSDLNSMKQDGTNVDVLMLTSGTTGTPKIVMRTPSDFLLMASGVIKHARIAENDTMMVLSPIAQGFGYLGAVAVPALSRARVVLLPEFDAERALGLIREERVTHLVAVPAQIIRLINTHEFEKNRPETLKVFISSGAYLPPETAREVEKEMGCRVVNLYGSLDVGMGTFTDYDDPPEFRLDTVGRRAEVNEVQVMDEENREVSPCQVGEVVIRGPITMSGYYKDSEATNQVFDSEGWGHTGDLGVFDKRGYLRIVGRKKEQISRGGTKISPIEIEDAMRTHPKVLDVAVIGMPDQALGERTCAYVVLRKGEKLSLEDAVQFLHQKNLATYKFPERVEIVAELPVSSGGKVQKYMLQQDITEKLKNEGKI